MIPASLSAAAWKRQARIEAKRRRAGCDPTLGAAIGARILRDLPPPAGAVVGGVWPLPDEPDLRPLLWALHRAGLRIALPITPAAAAPLSFHAWTPDSAMIPGRFGTHHPRGAPLTPTYLLVPLLAFDRRGHRLGYGGGYYDRTLASLPHATAVGFGYACLELPSIRTEPTDRQLWAIATESETIRMESHR